MEKYIGVLVNAAAVLVCGLLGVLLKKGIPVKIADAVMTALGLCVMYIGIDGALEGTQTLGLIISMVLGTVFGMLIDIDGKLNRLGMWVERKVNRVRSGDGKSTIAEGFVSASLLFCVGAMAIVGSFQAGLQGDNQILFTKSLIDGISACMLASTLGIGVCFSAVCLLIYQGGLVLLSGLLTDVLTDAALIAEIGSCGSLLIVCIGLNMLKITKIKAANMLPAVLFVPFTYWLMGVIGI